MSGQRCNIVRVCDSVALECARNRSTACCTLFCKSVVLPAYVEMRGRENGEGGGLGWEGGASV